MTAPQEKRCFYSKPHHALSMMLDHGMELLVEHFATKELLPANPEWLAMHICGKLSGEPVKDVRLFVASQSMHLLEPSAGDLVFAFYADYTGDGEWAYTKWTKHHTRYWSEPTIIQRNGMAFMWPQEAA